MKIGTDGVLLGAWTSVAQYPDSILDIGTGTGVIALMLAQRSDAMTVDAVELDDSAYEQAADNFENSVWGDRLFCYHAHLYEFAAEIDDEYDLIVCNPPFYMETLNDESTALQRSRSIKDGAAIEAREQARLEESMPFELLVGAVAKLLSEDGAFSVIIPHEREDDFILLCSRAGLFPSRITRVKGNPTSPIKRSLMEFRFRESVPNTTELTIEYKRQDYTDDYISLVKDFYLKM
ncbi:MULTISPECIES: tRNA1(Val) (adenine(37)-N6)-methyltransferase [unclassified Dokdonia]|uniref:tRNA1(Val) (adenine(37)-N6)-methyltransferase n=1 Tax=unclassified Dokdonia TaxID=2615033 RepID=UPI001ED8E9D6|nr:MULTISPECIES: methyltransferase [unclassified Dokdonia]